MPNEVYQQQTTNTVAMYPSRSVLYKIYHTINSPSKEKAQSPMDKPKHSPNIYLRYSYNILFVTVDRFFVPSHY